MVQSFCAMRAQMTVSRSTYCCTANYTFQLTSPYDEHNAKTMTVWLTTISTTHCEIFALTTVRLPCQVCFDHSVRIWWFYYLHYNHKRGYASFTCTLTVLSTSTSPVHNRATLRAYVLFSYMRQLLAATTSLHWRQPHHYIHCVPWSNESNQI